MLGETLHDTHAAVTGWDMLPDQARDSLSFLV